MLRIILLFCIIFLSKAEAQIIAEEEKSSVLDTVVAKLFITPEEVRNQVSLDLDYGISLPQLQSVNMDKRIARTFLLELKYGFTRIKPIIDYRRFYYSSEFAFLGNISSDLKPGSWIKVGNISDMWRFGFGYRNGYGYNLDKSTNLILYHSAAITWSHLDMYSNPGNIAGLEALKSLYNEFKFGSKYEAGIKYQLYKPIFLNFSYESSLIYPAYLPWKWMGSNLIELIIQRGYDLIAHLFIEDEPNLVPLTHFIVKNSTSILINKLKKDKMYYPFQSSAPIYHNNIRIGISLIF